MYIVFVEVDGKTNNPSLADVRAETPARNKKNNLKKNLWDKPYLGEVPIKPQYPCHGMFIWKGTLGDLNLLKLQTTTLKFVMGYEIKKVF